MFGIPIDAVHSNVAQMAQDLSTEGAAAVIFGATGRVLLVKENYDRCRWSLPGGMIEPGETPEEAAVRT
jgi:8-oxo-dGTP pyrophosphatase MutT (NUDIX family)